MGQRRRLASLLLFLWLVWECCWAGEPGRFVVSQVFPRLPVMTVYLDVLDEKGEPPSNLTAAELSATIQGQQVTVSQVIPFNASGEGVAYIFLVDISRSIGAPQFAQMRQAMDTWIDGLKPADRMAIFTFGQQYKELAGFTNVKASLKSALQDLKPTDPQTKLYLALNSAMNFSHTTTAGIPNRRVIVILTDGKDEGSGITIEDVRDLIQQSHMPIYAIGYSRLPVQEREKYLEVLNRLATLSGGVYEAASSFKTAYEEMQAAIRRLFVVRLECEGCRVESQLHPLEMTLTSGGFRRTSSLSVGVLPPSPPSTQEPHGETPHEPWWKNLFTVKVILSWEGLLALVAVVSVIFIVVLVVKKPTPPLPPPPPPPEEPAVTPGKVPGVVVSVGRRVQLTVVGGNRPGRTDYVNLTRNAVIGRDRGCDVAFTEDTEMSGRHFELLRADPYIEVRDLGSTNGTLLNGAQLVASKRLEDGDLVRAGRTEIRINFGGQG